ncbi:large ribosomal subunit protein bL17m-like [Clavelina lepadiformis]|uniref:large ribosomal subunit protein bL17m-like n=1 Tax=Clavelina lepadiformis TaxID=159417 RepID=UPI0040433E12
MPRGMPHGNSFRKFGGPDKRLHLLKTLVNALIKHERLETTFAKAYETQKYVERLIDITKYGKSNLYCNDMVNFWVPEEAQQNKLFNVLLPRYSEHSRKYTRLAVLTEWTDKDMKSHGKMAVIELKGNPLPPLPVKEDNPHTLQNVLLAAAKQDWDYQRSNVKEN